MSNWDTLSPTPKQIEAIQFYERRYDVKIDCKNKQDAHNVISLFVKDKRLSFKSGYIVGTNVKYASNKITETPIQYIEEKYNIDIDTIDLDSLVSIMRKEGMLSRAAYNYNSWAFDTIYGNSFGNGSNVITGELSSNSIKNILINILKEYNSK